MMLIRFDSHHSSPRNFQRIHLDPLMDVNAPLHGSLGVGPPHAIVAGSGSLGIVRSAEHGPHAASAQVDLRTDSLDRIRTHEFCGCSKSLVDFGAGSFSSNAGLGVGDPEHSFLAMHDTAIRLGLQPRIEIHATLIELHGFRNAVIGANDGSVSAGVAGTYIVALKHRDVRDSVPRGEVIRGRKTVAASAYNHNVV